MTLEHLMFSAILFLGVSVFFVTLSGWLKLGSIIGFLAAGIALGPHTPGYVLSEDTDAVLNLGELGIVLLMFTIGLEMQPSRLWSMRRLLFGLGPVQFLLTGAAIAASLLLVSQLSLKGAIIVGLGLALSSTAIGMQILGEKGEVASEHGKATFAILVFQDLASVLLLVLVPFLAVAAAPNTALPWWEQVLLVVAALGGVILAGRYALPFIFRWTAKRQSLTEFGVIVLIAVMGAAILMEQAGLSMAMGTFVLGVMLSESDFRSQVEAAVSQLKGISMALFFVAVGMSIDLEIVLSNAPKLALLVLQVVVIKVFFLVLLGLLFGLGRAGSLRTACLLSSCSEFGFVVFAAARSGGLLTDHAFAIAVVIISLSMALSPFLVKLGYWLAKRLAKTPRPESPLKQASEELENHVVVAGCGYPGRLMCVMLEKTDTPYIAFDLNFSRVREARKDGLKVYFGDVSNPEMQGAAAFSKARSVVVTLEDMHAAGRLVDELRNFYPHLPIQLAAPNLVTQDAMRAKGVADAICTPVEGSLTLGSAMLRAAGVAEDDADALLETLRQDDYAFVREELHEKARR